MYKFIIALCATLLSFAAQAASGPVLWFCSNENQLHIYLAVDSGDGAFIIFDSRGISLGSSKFEIGKDDNNEDFFYSQIAYKTTNNESAIMLVVVYVNTTTHTAKLGLQPIDTNSTSAAQKAVPTLVMLCH